MRHRVRETLWLLLTYPLVLLWWRYCDWLDARRGELR